MGVVGHSPASGREAWLVSLQCMDSQGDWDATRGLARRASCAWLAMSCPAALPMFIKKVNTLPLLVYCGLLGSGHFSVLQTSCVAVCAYLI